MARRLITLVGIGLVLAVSPMLHAQQQPKPQAEQPESAKATPATQAPEPQPAPAPAQPNNARCETWDGRVGDLHIAEDRSVIAFRPDAGQPCSLQVSDRALRESLKKLKDDDIVHLASSKQGTELWDVQLQRGSVGKGSRVLVLFIGAVLLFTGVRLTVGKDWPHLVLGMDKRYSKSKTQMAAWFGILIVTYVAAVILRFRSSGHFVGSVDIPNNLLLISGLSAFSFAGAKGLTTQKENQAATARALGQPAPPPKVNPGQPAFLHDLVYDDDPTNPQPDLGDFQMLVVTALAIAVYLLTAFKFLGSMPLQTTLMLPDVDTTILAAFGIGQGAYLAKKAVS